MARKFFNQKIPNKKKTTTQIIVIGACIIGIIICFIVANRFSQNKNTPKAVIELRDSVAIEINGELPDKTIFFAELTNVKEDAIKIDYNNVDTHNTGEYDVLIQIDNKTYNTKLKVVDTETPTLELQNVIIELGATYTVNDFVKSCTDNSGKTCRITYYTNAVNQDGETIDYSNYSEAGTYTIQIVASDDAGNITSPAVTQLTIGQIQPPVTTVCKYGNNLYDTSKYTLATLVTEDNCAIDLNLYHNKETKAAVEKIMDAQTKKLKNEFRKNNINEMVTLNRKSEAVLNIAGTGIVGYTLHMEAVITKNGEKEVVASFYVDLSGNRKYEINKYNLP